MSLPLAVPLSLVLLVAPVRVPSPPLDDRSDAGRPATARDAVPYVIVTTQELRPAFLELAHWKSRHGTRAVVRTLESLRRTYPQAPDDAARVRTFLQDAHAQWGTRWVLLGGDTDQMPARRVVVLTGLGLEGITTDRYFACLDGTWNADGDDLYAEPEDQVDFTPDLFLGRAPVSGRAEARAFVAKTIGYLEHPGDNEGTNLVLAGDLVFVDGAAVAESVWPIVGLHPEQHVARLYASSNPKWVPPVYPLTWRAALDSLDAGYRFVIGIGRGDPGRFQVEATESPNAYLTVADALALRNHDRLSHVWLLAASTCDIGISTCFGEALLRSAGGAVSVVGSTCNGFLGMQQAQLQAFARLVFDERVATVGEAFTRQLAPLVEGGVPPEPFAFYGGILLGDPQLPILAPSASATSGLGDEESLTHLHPDRRGATSADAATEATAVEGAASVLDLAASPNPVGGALSLRYAVPAELAGEPLELAIWDVSGRRVRVLARGVAGSGFGVRLWNRIDEAGHRAARGVYFARLSVGAKTVLRRVILLD